VMTLTGIPRTVPLTLWVDELEKSVQDNHVILTDQNPGSKLLDLFQMLSSQSEISTKVQPSFEVTRLVHDSKHAVQPEAVSRLDGVVDGSVEILASQY
jgi:hypothetical protein